VTDRSEFAGYSGKSSGVTRPLALVGNSNTEKPSWPAAFVPQTKAVHMDASGRISLFKVFLQTGAIHIWTSLVYEALLLVL